LKAQYSSAEIKLDNLIISSASSAVVMPISHRYGSYVGFKRFITSSPNYAFIREIFLWIAALAFGRACFTRGADNEHLATSVKLADRTADWISLLGQYGLRHEIIKNQSP
jgi:hypothetical protein